MLIIQVINLEDSLVEYAMIVEYAMNDSKSVKLIILNRTYLKDKWLSSLVRHILSKIFWIYQSSLTSGTREPITLVYADFNLSVLAHNLMLILLRKSFLVSFVRSLTTVLTGVRLLQV